MIRILLIRHATTELQGKLLYGRMPGICLSADGYREAARLADALRTRYKLDRVVASPLERAQETARAIAAAAHKDVETDERLTELDHGDWVGRTFEELENLQEWKTYNSSRGTASAPRGESTLQAQARAWAAVEDLRRNHSGATVALVSHGDIIRALLVLLLGMPLDLIWRIDVLPASVSEVSVYSQGATVHNINLTY